MKLLWCRLGISFRLGLGFWLRRWFRYLFRFWRSGDRRRLDLGRCHLGQVRRRYADRRLPVFESAETGSLEHPRYEGIEALLVQYAGTAKCLLQPMLTSLGLSLSASHLFVESGAKRDQVLRLHDRRYPCKVPDHRRRPRCQLLACPGGRPPCGYVISSHAKHPGQRPALRQQVCGSLRERLQGWLFRGADGLRAPCISRGRLVGRSVAYRYVLKLRKPTRNLRRERVITRRDGDQEEAPGRRAEHLPGNRRKLPRALKFVLVRFGHVKRRENPAKPSPGQLAEQHGTRPWSGRAQGGKCPRVAFLE